MPMTAARTAASKDAIFRLPIQSNFFAGFHHALSGFADMFTDPSDFVCFPVALGVKLDWEYTYRLAPKHSFEL
jgi:hypothetical protein